MIWIVARNTDGEIVVKEGLVLEGETEAETWINSDYYLLLMLLHSKKE
jgi:hypothetical protein